MLRKISLVQGAPLVPIAVLEALVACGFPSPSQDYETREIDLVEHLGLRSPTTDLLQQEGSDLEGIGIFDGDYIIVDRSLTPELENVVVAIVDDELVLKTLARSGGRLILRAENPLFPSIALEGEMEMTIWGVVTFSIHPARHQKRT